MKQTYFSRASAWFWLAGALAACGSLNDGTILVVDGAGGQSGEGGDVSVSGSGNPGGDTSSGGSADPSGGSPEGGTNDGGEPPVIVPDEPPTVVSISPEDSMDEIEPRARVVLKFSESVAEDSLDGAITVSDEEGEREANLALDGEKVTLTFLQRLDLLTTYTVRVSTDVTDLAGNPLPNTFTSTFKVRDGKWGDFVVLNNPRETGRVSSDAFPPPVFDGAGNGLAVWSQQDGVNGPLAIWGRAYNPVRGWQPAVELSAAAEDCDLPSVSMNQSGDAVVAWRQTDGSFARVFARRYLSGTWESAPLKVDVANVNQVSGVTTAMTEAGDAHVLWRYKYSSYLFLAGNTATGSGDWKSSNIEISSQFDALSGPTVAFNADGAGFAIWAGLNGSASIVRVARYLPATGWANLENAPGSAGATVDAYTAPSIAVDKRGGAMAVWSTPTDVATSRFTKANGWSDKSSASGAGTGSIAPWPPRVAAHGNSFVAHWHQAIGNVTNAFANTFSEAAWGAPPALLSDGDTSVFGWSETALGLDRHGNGVATWVQGADVKFARLIGADGSWLEAAVVQKLTGDPTEARSSVATNGMAAVIASNGYPYYERHDDLFAGVFQ